MALKLQKFSMFQKNNKYNFFRCVCYSTIVFLGFGMSTFSRSEENVKNSPLSKSEVKALWKEFKKSRKAQTLALNHQQSMETQALKSLQAHHYKEWDTNEREARHKFFKENLKGSNRRAYVQDFIQRREGFLKLIKEERALRLKEQEVRRNSLKAELDEKEKKFKELLDKNERPPNALWP